MKRKKGRGKKSFLLGGKNLYRMIAQRRIKNLAGPAERRKGDAGSSDFSKKGSLESKHMLAGKRWRTECGGGGEERRNSVPFRAGGKSKSFVPGHKGTEKGIKEDEV